MDLSLSSICYGVFCQRLVYGVFLSLTYLQRIVVSSTIRLFVGFHVDNSNGLSVIKLHI